MIHYAGMAFYEPPPGRNSEQIERRTSNVQHRTSNIERRILMTLRFADIKINKL
jgi:hypothetical protein